MKGPAHVFILTAPTTTRTFEELNRQSATCLFAQIVWQYDWSTHLFLGETVLKVRDLPGNFSWILGLAKYKSILKIYIMLDVLKKFFRRKLAEVLWRGRVLNSRMKKACKHNLVFHTKRNHAAWTWTIFFGRDLALLVVEFPQPAECAGSVVGICYHKGAMFEGLFPLSLL